MNIVHARASLTTANRQRGVVFIVSLIILLIMSMLAIGSIRVTALEERMAGNSSDRNVAFQSAESTVREAELYVEHLVSLGDFDTANGLIGRTNSEPVYNAQETWTEGANHVVASTNFGSYDRPRYFIKHFTTVTGTEGALNMSGYGDNKGTGDVAIFRVTARGTGISADSAEVIIRSQYGRIF
jgi:type IV pilus assembly protein PilX